MELLRNVSSGVIHHSSCRAAVRQGSSGVLVPWLLAKDLDPRGVAEFSEHHNIHLCRCLEPVRCRCHSCAPIEPRP